MVMRSPPVNAYDADDNVLLQVNLASFQTKIPTSYTFIVDVSGSMHDNLPILKEILLRWLETVDVGSGLVFVLIRAVGELCFQCDYLTEEKRREAIHKIQVLHADGQTNIEDGINVAKEAMCSLNPNMQRKTIILTDGQANKGQVDASYLAAMTAPMGKVDAVMLTTASDAMFVNKLKLINTENVGHFAATGDKLATVFNEIFNVLNTRQMTVQVGDICKSIPSHVANSMIDLLYAIHPATNPTVLVKAEQSNGESEILFESRFIEIERHLEPRLLKARINIAMAMKKVGLIEDDFMVNNAQANFSDANGRLSEILEVMLTIKVDAPEVIEEVAYRSLSVSYQQLKDISNAFSDTRIPEACPVAFEEVIEENDDAYDDNDGPAYRSLSTRPAVIVEKKFASTEDEAKYHAWAIAQSQIQTSMSNKDRSIHKLAALKKSAF